MMRLFLQSLNTTGELPQLLKMAGSGRPRLAIIPNALDAIPIEAREIYSRDKFDVEAHFDAAGFDPVTIDLRDYFGDTRRLGEILAGFRVFYATGGNTFLLRRAMRLSGFDELLPQLLEDGSIYAGWSAGTCVASTSLEVVASMDEPYAKGIGHPPGEPIFEGLDLIPFGIVPHFRSPHPESDAAEIAHEAAVAQKLPHMTLRDGETLIVDGKRQEVIGEPVASISK